MLLNGASGVDYGAARCTVLVVSFVVTAPVGGWWLPASRSVA